MKTKNNNPYRVVVIQHKKSNAVFIIRTKSVVDEKRLLKTKTDNFNRYRTVTHRIENITLKYFCDKYIFFKHTDFNIIHRELAIFSYGDCIRRMSELATGYRENGWSVLNGKLNE